MLTACAVEPALGVRVPLLPRRGRSSGAECRSDMPATKVRFLPTSRLQYGAVVQQENPGLANQ